MSKIWEVREPISIDDDPEMLKAKLLYKRFYRGGFKIGVALILILILLIIWGVVNWLV